MNSQQNLLSQEVVAEQIPKEDSQPQQDSVGEQPIPQNDGVLAASAENKVLDTTTHLETGSQFGKFATADALMNAYNNLQSEFTKKCQKLSEYEKSNSDNVENEVKSLEQTFSPSSALTPLYENESWNSTVANFLDTHAEAKPFAKQISEEILNNYSQYQSANALEDAWATIATKHFVSKESLSKDQNFLNEYVFSNPETVQKVLSMFITKLENSKPPTLILSQGQHAFYPNKVANNLEEAKTIVHNMFL